MKANLLVFDTSYLVRLYLEDAGFEKVRNLAMSAYTISAAWHAQVEVVAAFHRIYRERRINKQEYLLLMDQFSADLSTPLFQWFDFNEKVRLRLTSFFREASATVFLRAADALHLASAVEHGFTKIYSNDRHLLAAAPFFELDGVNVING